MSTRTRLVLAIAPDRVAMALAVKDAVIREEDRELADHGSLGSVARDLVDRVVATNSGRTDVDLLVCKPLASRKVLFGVAPTSRAEEVRSRLREAPHAFFLGDDGAIVAGEPVARDDEWWATAIDRELLESLMHACEGLSIDRCRVIVLDGPLDAEALVGAARDAASRPVIDALALDPLAGLRLARGLRQRLWLLAATLLLGLGASAIGPALLHAAFARREARELASLQETVNATHAWARNAAAQRLDDGARLAALDARAPLRTPLVGSLGSALPDSAVVMSLALDSTSGTMVVLAPPGTEVLRAVSTVPTILEPRLSGSVTRERLGERDVTRTTIAFRLAPAGDPR